MSTTEDRPGGDRPSEPDLAADLAAGAGMTVGMVRDALHRLGLATDNVWLAEAVVRQARAELGDDVAAELLAATDPAELLDRMAAVEYLFPEDGPPPPLYTRAELADQLDRLAGFLRSQAANLLRTGLPDRRFDGCRWLWDRFGRLYPTRTCEDAEPYPDSDRPYTWIRLCYTPLPDSDVGGADWVGPLAAPVAGDGDPADPFRGYEDADLREELAGFDEAAVESLRAPVHDLKLAVVEAAARALRGRLDQPDWWVEPMAAGVGRMDPDRAEFALHVDEAYARPPAGWSDGSVPDVLGGVLVGYSGPVRPGGLTAVLDLIAHVEWERTAGTWQPLAEAVRGRGGLMVGPGATPPRSYFAAVEWGVGPDVAALTATLTGCERAEAAFRERFTEYLRARLEVCLRRRVTVNLPPCPPALLGRLREYLDRQAVRFVAAAGGDEPPPSGPPPPDPNESEPEPAYLLRKSPTAWLIRFAGGPSVSMMHCVGMYHLATLLSHPNENLTPEELLRERIRLEGKRAPSRRVATSKEERDKVGVGGAKDSGRVLEAEGVAEVKARIERLTKELDDAVELKRPEEELHEKRQELAELDKYLTQAFRPAPGGKKVGRKPAIVGDMIKRNRDTVGRAIKAAIEFATGADPEFGSHLKERLTRTPPYRYRAVEGVRWVVDL